MSTKVEQVLGKTSDWNQAKNDEPVFVIRALNWKAALLVASLANLNNSNRTVDDLVAVALAMREYHEDNDIPF